MSQVVWCRGAWVVEKERGATHGWSCLGWAKQHVPVQQAVHHASRHRHHAATVTPLDCEGMLVWYACDPASRRSLARTMRSYRKFVGLVTAQKCRRLRLVLLFFLGRQTELEKRFSKSLEGLPVPFWSSDRLIFAPFRKHEQREWLPTYCSLVTFAISFFLLSSTLSPITKSAS
jgi:hypothetical protein